MGNHDRALRTIVGLLALGLLRATSDRDPKEVLKQAAAKVLASADRVPDYTCIQTVERNYYRPLAATLPRACPFALEDRRRPNLAQQLRLFSTDRLRLDVTLAAGGEIYSWAGASYFEDAGIDKVVRDGPFGSGAFGGFLSVIFRLDAKQFHFEGENVADGSNMMEYSFRVAREDSHYRVKTDNTWPATAYYGSIFVNPATDDVVRLRVETGELPAATGICQANTTLDFGAVQIGLAPFLLPVHARQTFIAPDGSEVQNKISFGNCREYRGESTITFEASPGSLAGEPSTNLPAQRAVQLPSLHAGLAFTLELLDPIDTDRAAAGDLFRAKLVRALRDRNLHTLARAGSIVWGRLRRVQGFVRPDEVYVVLAPGTVSIGDERVPLTANRDWSSSWRETRAKGPQRGANILLPQPGEAPAGVFRFPGQHVVVPKGFRSDWRTAEARGQ